MFASWLFSYVVALGVASAETSLRADIENTISAALMKKPFSQKELASLKLSLKEIPQGKKGATISDKIYADLLIEGLDLIPAEKLDSKSCQKTRSQVLVQLEPSSDREPAHPALKEVFKIINILCR